MDEKFLKASIVHDLGLSERNSVNIHLTPDSSMLSMAKSSITGNDIEHQQLSCDDSFFSPVSKMVRWKSEIESLNFQTNSKNQSQTSSDRNRFHDISNHENSLSTPYTDVLISPLSRLSTSSSIMSLKSIGNYKTNEQQLIKNRSKLMNSTDQLIAANENNNISSSVSSFMPLSSRSKLASIDNNLSSIIDNDLQRVPPSFMQLPPSSTFINGSTIQSQLQTHVVHNTSRSNSMVSWRGYLPIQFEPMNTETIHFSQKVFLGGIPSQLSEAELLLILRKFGKCNIKWPKNDGTNHNVSGFCHVVYRESRSVCELLKNCMQHRRSTIDYFLHIHLLSSTIQSDQLKPIQVVPWNTKDNVYVIQQKTRSMNNDGFVLKDWSRTIFVSPLHGKMTAFSLATIMSSVFGSVLMAQINTDKYGYPTGTGTVLFNDSHSYMRAVAAGVIDIKCDSFHKLLDIDPFLRENEPCGYCSTTAELFCRNFHCLRSYCKQCWINRHGLKALADHQPVTRKQQTF